MRDITLLIQKVKQKLARTDVEKHEYKVPALSPTLLKTQSKREIEYLKHIKKLENILKQDPMTGLYTKQHFDVLEKKKGFYIIIDGDNLKKINDKHGHAAGHAAIEALSEGIKKVTRAEEFKVSRMGGDEFVVHSKTISIATALKIAKRILESIHKQKISDFFKGKESVKKELENVPLQASIGVGSTEEDADKALYQAKNKGRNRVEYLKKEKLH